MVQPAASLAGLASVVIMEDVLMNTLISIAWRRSHPLALVALVTTLGAAVSAAAQDVSFDFSRLVEYREVAPQDGNSGTHERIVEMKLPVSVRFQGLAVGEVELLDFEIDGTPAGIRIESFSPATELATDAVSIETINKTVKERSLGAALSGKLPMPVGPLTCDVGPSISGGVSKANEATEKVQRLPPKKPVVVSGTFAQGQGVFFKFKQSSQTSFEGVHELTVRFAVPSDWRAGAVRVSAAARGHRPRLWIDQPTVFTEMTANVELYPAGDYARRKAALRRLDVSEGKEKSGWGLGDLFLTSGARG
jgi:hypothetical protein